MTPVNGGGGTSQMTAGVGGSGDAGVAVDAATCRTGDCWWSSVGGDRCRSAGLPLPTDRPSDAPDGTAPVADVYLGFTQVHLGATDPNGQQSNDAWQQLGFDLDGVCTNSATCASSSVASCRSTGPATPFDGQLCRDNTFGRLQPVITVMPELGTKYGLGEDAFNCELWRGGYNMLVRLSGYNGKANDAHVRVDYYLSTGLEMPAQWKCPAQDYKTSYARWRSLRTWSVDDSALSAPITVPGTLPNSKFADADAYVKSGYLVAVVPDGTQQGFIGDGDPYRGFLFQPRHGVFTGKLSQAQDGTWEIDDGLIGGRIRKDDLVQSFREMGFCETGDFSTFYQSMLDFIDETVDVLASGRNDSGMTCDAMSYGIGFEAAQLTPGGSVTVPPRIECCAPGKSLAACMAKCGDGIVSGDEKCDTAILAGLPGACPTACNTTDACAPLVLTGSTCSVACTSMPVTSVGPKDGCCPPGANFTADADCASMCGNGVIERGETCDPPSSCTACASSTNACLTVRTSGSAETCNLQCLLTPVTACIAGDNCCPAGCQNSTDMDCPMSCGNNKLDPGETCDIGSSTPCPTSCDDAQACTADQMTGSASNCTLTCTHVPITAAHDGDGCCPANATPNTDSDCMATCGNHIVEAGEECDDGNTIAGDGCFHCKTETPQQICLASIGASDSCAQCGCAKCTSQSVTCYGSSVAGDNKLCADMVKCQQTSKCGNPDCFCGQDPLLTCLTGVADGICKNQIIGAAKSSSLVDISQRGADPNYPLGRANAVYTCLQNNCAAECTK